jgi:hypothetical protein
MIKDIKYSGYSAVPSDYECQDGPQSGMLNLIPEDGALKPIFDPKPILNCNLGGVVKLIHHVPNQDNYIIVRVTSDGHSVYWLKKTDLYANENNAIFIATYSAINDFAIVGNTLAIATDEGLRYLLWKDGAYITLASKPPFVPISFGCSLVGTLTDSEELTITLNRYGRPLDTEENTSAVLGLLLSSVSENITSKGYFYMPFFVRYAYRLYDGSYSWHSAPILMLPNVIPPLIKVGDGYSKNSGENNIESTLNVPYFSLDYKVLADDATEAFKDWKDLIAGIDIFISQPIYTYDQSKRLVGISSSRTVLLNSYYDWNPDGLDLRNHSDIIPEKIFVGHYSASSGRGRGSGSYNTSSNFIDYFETTDGDSSYTVYQLAKNDNFHDKIKGVNLFYKIATLEMDSISAMDEYKILSLESTELDSLVTRQTLTDDYQSHCELSADYLLSFNSRLNLAGIKLTPAQPFALKSCVQATTSSSEKSVKITVYTRLNGLLCKVTNQVVSNATNWDIENSFPRYIYYPDASAYKMVFQYDDNTEIIIDLTPHDYLNGAYWYGLLGLDAKPTTNAEAETKSASLYVPMSNKIYTSEVNNPFSFPVEGINTVGSGTVIGISTAAKALSQGQFGQFPLYAFTTEGIWALEVGSNGLYTTRQPITRDVCTNAKGITQIDSAVLFPSSRGVMLISGANSLCISEAIGTETPFALSNLPAMDSIAKLVGCTANQYNYEPFGTSLANCQMVYDYLHQRIIICGDSSCAYVYSLKSKDWGIMANVVKSVVDSYPEALAMSQDGKLVDFSQNFVGWQYSDAVIYPTVPEIAVGTALSHVTGLASLDSVQTSVAKAKAVINTGSVTAAQSVQLSMRSSGFFVTRPIKLEMPDVLKTMDTIIQRGNFAKGHVQSALYGSRDLINWHLVWSSKDHYLRGFRGTPYKYFRIACVTSLAEGESIYGASLQFNARQTDQPR